jgi:hypothetical protein
MIGNGNFAFTADITGLQTFPEQYSPLVPLMTQAQWAWHSFPNSNHYTLADSFTPVDVRGTKQLFPYFSDWERAKEPAIKWLRENPHRFSLGRVGLHMIHADGTPATFADISKTSQKLDMWNGVLISDFVFDDQPVHVETRVHQAKDMLIVRLRSPLLAQGRVSIDLKFPGLSKQLNPNPADWNSPDSHQTKLIAKNARSFNVQRTLDDTRYFVAVTASHDIRYRDAARHKINLSTSSDELILLVQFAKKDQPLSYSQQAISDVANHWNHYWSNGGFVDFTASTDPRAIELQRRVLLSQYLMAVNAAGEYPPQEDGLFSNSWNGKFHLEMTPWHMAQFASWGHVDLLERVMPWYLKHLPAAKALAKEHGVKGAWWPKMTGPEGRESPSAVNPFIMWQQPHPIYLAELIYRSKPNAKTLSRYQQLVFETADLLAAYPHFDQASSRYVLGPPIIPVQEVFEPLSTFNPAFELEYFRFGLATAQQWRERLHLPRNPEWDRVLSKLSPLPQQDGMYLPTESHHEFWKLATSEKCSHEIKDSTCLNRDHPSMLMALGLLPGSSVDAAVMSRTLDAVDQHWDLRQMWGWDFPMMAMTAMRLNHPDRAIDYLLADQRNNQYGVTGMTARMHLSDNKYVVDSQTYFPSNGSLLLAVGMIAVGWDGKPVMQSKNSSDWIVHSEGILPIP